MQIENEEKSLTYQPKRHRKKLLYKTILNQIEFYMGDSNLSKDRYICTLFDQDSYITVSEFLKFNKIRKLTQSVDDIKKAIKVSEILELSPDQEKVKRITPVKVKQNVDECTIYVENINSDTTHEFLTEVFSKFGKVVYVSIPKYRQNQLNKGFAFIEYDTETEVQEALSYFDSVGCKMTSSLEPKMLCSIKSFIEENNPPAESQKEEESKPKETEGTVQSEDESPAKRIKLDDESETEANEKKRKKKEEKKKNFIKELNFRILSKTEWKKMRNAYLNMQRKQAKELKKYLHRSKLKRLDTENKVEKQQTEQQKCEEKIESSSKITPGTIVKVFISEPVKSVKLLKAEIKSNFNDVQYVDISPNLGENLLFVRFSTDESANNFCKSQFNGEKSILKDEEENAYLQKIEEDRTKKLNKDRKKERGKDKLLRKAQNEMAKHKKFPENE